MTILKVCCGKFQPKSLGFTRTCPGLPLFLEAAKSVNLPRVTCFRLPGAAADLR